MSRIYKQEEMKEILHRLGIETINGKINSQHVARIWTWRMKDEQGIDHTYTDTNVRGHVSKKTLPVADTINTRMNLYEVRDAFTASLNLNRAGKKKQFSSTS